MEKAIILSQLEDLCNTENDREINMEFVYCGVLFHAKYLFLGNKLYVTDTVKAIELNDLEFDILIRIIERLKVYDN